MKAELIGHIISSTFCAIASILITYQVVRHPNKLRLSILFYSAITLPASIICTLRIADIVSDRVNSLTYLVSTLLMAGTHCFMLLDVGRRLRTEHETSWKNPLVITGLIFLGITGALLLTEISILAVNKSGHESFPLKGCFIAGVVACIIGDSAIFTFTFQPLIYLKERRVTEGQSTTTALGVWFFLIQNVWYMIYGALYVWFFAVNSWSYFRTLLSIDYVLRFIENLLYTWPPPRNVIGYLSSKLPGSSFQLSTRKSTNQAISSERYNMQPDVEIQQEDKDLEMADTQQTHSSFGSKVTIITK